MENVSQSDNQEALPVDSDNLLQYVQHRPTGLKSFTLFY